MLLLPPPLLLLHPPAGTFNPANLKERGPLPRCVGAALAMLCKPELSVGQYWQTGREQLRFLQQEQSGDQLMEGVVAVAQLTKYCLSEGHVYLRQDCPLRLALEEFLQRAGKVGGWHYQRCWGGGREAGGEAAGDCNPLPLAEHPLPFPRPRPLCRTTLRCPSCR